MNAARAGILLGVAAALALTGCGQPVRIPLPADLEQATDGRLRRAVDDATSAVRREPDSALVWVRLGHIYLVHEWDVEAAECYRRATRIEPDEPKWHYYLGRSLLSIDDRQAAEALARSLELAEYAPARFYLGEALLSLGRFDEASGQLERLVAIDPDQPHVRRTLGELALGAGRLAEARAELERAVAVAPDFSPAHAGLARVLLALGETGSAARHAELARRPSQVAPFADPLWQAVEMMSAAPEGFFARAAFFFENGQVERGMAELERVVADGQDDPEVWLYYAGAMFERGEFARAARALETLLGLGDRAARRLPPHKLESCHLLLGASLARLGNAAAAEPHLVRALELNPESTAARRELDVLRGQRER